MSSFDYHENQREASNYLNYTSNVTLLINSSQQLHDVNRKIHFPFAIELLPNELLTCYKPYRLLPQKRLTVLANWRGQTVIAKLFYDKKRGKKHFLRDLTGCLAMQTNAVNTANLIHAGHSQGKNISVIVLQYLEGADPLTQKWLNMPANVKVAILKQIVAMLAQLHQSGHSHQDLHLNNFLLQQQKPFMIDGGSVIVERDYKPLSIKKSLENLAFFCSKLSAADQHYWHYLINEYFIVRNIQHDHAKLINYFDKMLQKRLQEKNAKISKKAFRECTAFKVKKSWNERIIVSRLVDPVRVDGLLSDLNTPFQHAEKLKSGNTCTLIRHEYDQHTYVIKRYNIKNIWHRLSRCCRATRASYSWQNAYLLNQFSIATPTAVALVEQRFGFLRGMAYYIYHYIDAILLKEFFEKHRIFDVTIAQRVVELLQQLHNAKLCHGDLKASNILLEKNKPLLIDLDGLRYYKSRFLFKRAWRRDIQRFLRNWQDKPQIQAIFSELLRERQLLT